MAQKAKFGSKLGLIAATVGSAVGLGNVWRFPAETQANGGAAFLLVYIACVFLLGIPVMMAEFALGRAGQSDATGAFRKLSPGSGWWGTGLLAIIASYLILAMYIVVAAWTVEYTWQSVTGDLYAGLHSSSRHAAESFFASKMHDYIFSDSAPLIFICLIIAANIGILIKGVQKGIERVCNVLMPLLFLLLVIFAAVSLSMPGASAGVEYFLKPDFSKISPAVVANALGQAFFSLSLGMGILITYASYFPKSTKLGSTALSVSMLDLLVAVLMGFVIFPASAAFGLSDADLGGTTLVFVTLPEIFAKMPATQLWSALFFLLLAVAALTSTVSLAEVSIAMVQDRFRRSRIQAALIVLLPLFILSTLISLSLNSFSDFKILGKNLFDLIDTGATNILLPLVAILTCIYMGWFAPKGILRNEITNNGQTGRMAASAVIVAVRFLAPVLLLFILIMGISSF